jgi:RecB family exonuclease
MTYLDRPPPRKGPPWAHNSLGASVHNALAGWWRLPRAGRTVPAAGDLLERGWIEEGFADQAQSTATRARARDMVERYAAGLDPDREPAGVERTVATKTDRIVVSGRIDRLDERPELVVVDYKTGRRRLTSADAKASLPLALYAIAAGRVLRRSCRTVELHHLPTGEVHAWEHSDATLSRHLGRAEDIAQECAEADERFGEMPPDGQDQVFPPRTGPGCGWCDYRAACPEGSAAAAARRPWDGISTADET